MMQIMKNIKHALVKTAKGVRDKFMLTPIFSDRLFLLKKLDIMFSMTMINMAMIKKRNSITIPLL